jgi:hypothetical protein
MAAFLEAAQREIPRQWQVRVAGADHTPAAEAVVALEIVGG